ncbi:MAG: DUF4124 domain-containing protein [Pseudomonadota bacterium]
MTRRTTIRIATLAASALVFAQASAEIYTWVDENGVVHYADQPQHKDAKRSEIDSERTDDGDAQRRLDSAVALSAAQRQAFNDARSEPDPNDLVAQAERTVELRRQSCEAARSKLQQFAQARRLYTLDEEGAKVYLDEDQTLAARAEVQAAVSEHCD